MPSFRQLLPRHPNSEGGSRPKSPRSPKSPSFSKTTKNYDRLDQCAGCYNVDILIRQNLAQQGNGSANYSSAILHNSFNELDQCAHKCQICRVFRQSLVLEEVTFDGIKQVRETSGEVMVRWQKSMTANSTSEFALLVEIRGAPTRAGVVNCSSQKDIEHLALSSNGLSNSVIEQANKWLQTCRNNHIGQCDNLKWSSENPRLLIEILSPDLIRLCENQVDNYVALSYCWGKETEEIKQGKTFSTNLNRRRQAFPIGELPTTIRDALKLIHAMGIHYAWIDSLCIPQDTKEGLSTMHKVYSNALFTLCACATWGATEKLIDRREAWTQSTELCRLGGLWLTTVDMSLNELRLRSPLASRAWTLQEERLSPRMLYVSSNRMYWSCGKAHEMELKPAYENGKSLQRRPVYAASDRDTTMPIAQEFLWACYDGTSNLHRFWADMVESYALRDMGRKSDRLKALSGLAAKYLSASKGDEYLAGIWAKNLAEGLAWRVQQAVEIDMSKVDPENLPPRLPSWSWAILPVKTTVRMNATSTRSSFFEWFGDGSTQTVGIIGDAEKAVQHGESIGRICVKGRMRPLWKATSCRREWSNFSSTINGEEKYSFESVTGQDTHAIEVNTGRILVYEDRQREVISQLDFQRDVRRLYSNQLYISALELGTSTMLLLERESQGVWRRIGVAWNVREDYFAFAPSEILILA
jgi:hypothetical protein